MEKLTKALMTDETGQEIVTKLTALSGQMHELAMATRGSAILFKSESDISVLGDGGYLAVYVGTTNPLVISGWTGDNSLVTGHLYYLIKSGTAVASRDLGEYGGAVTDTTLSISGAPADAKAVGDALDTLDTRVTVVEGEIPDVSVVDGRLVINGTSYEIGGVGIASITKTGTAGLVDIYTILMTDGTSTTFTVTNGDASDAKIQGFIEEWLEEHPEATTTVQDGAITLAKLAPEVTQKLSDVKLTYKWLACGYMRSSVRTFQGWTHNVVWEPDLGKAVGIVISSNAAHEYAKPWYRVTIDPSGYMSTYEAVTLYDTDGVTEYTSTAYYMGSLCRLSDGRYMAIDSGHDIYISTDYCKTFVRQQTYAFDETGSMFGLRQLSNGRLIVGFGGNRNGFYYSDDVGQTWTFTSADNSGLGQQAYPSGAFKPFEPCFIDCRNGKVACFARKSTNAFASGGSMSETVYKHLEPAVYSVSTDYGATWSAWVDSTTITDMTAGNAKYCIIDGTVHMVFASRLTHADGNLRIFYTYASIEDAYADNWATPVMIDAGHWDESTAENSHDGGYPSVWTDGIGNLFAVYYDGDGSGTKAGANWRLCMGAPAIQKPAVSDGSGAFNVGYSQKAIDKKTNALWAKINEILLLIGENPGDDGEYDGKSPVYDGLLAWFDVTQSSKWDGSVLSGMIGENSITCVKCNNQGAYISAQTPTAFNNGFMNQPALFLRDTLSEIGVTGAFTIEAVQWSDSNENLFLLKAANTFNQSTGNNATLYNRSRNINGAKSGVRHFVGVFTSGSVDWYVDGVLTLTEAMTLTMNEILAAYPLFYTNAHYHSDVRIYNKALSAEEIQNNFLYTQNETDYSTAPVFTTE